MNEPYTFSRVEETILSLLLDDIHNGKFGSQMVTESKEGRYTKVLKRGTIYTTLHRLETRGVVTSFLEDRPEGEFGRPRRRYTITAEGQQQFAQWMRNQQANAHVALAMLGMRLNP